MCTIIINRWLHGLFHGAGKTLVPTQADIPIGNPPVTTPGSPSASLFVATTVKVYTAHSASSSGALISNVVSA